MSTTLAQWGKRSTLERTVRGSNPGSGPTRHNYVMLIRMSIKDVRDYSVYLCI